jgi:hypothetical protein
VSSIIPRSCESYFMSRTGQLDADLTGDYFSSLRLHCSIERVTVAILFVFVLFLPEHDKMFVLLHVFVNFCCYEMILK